MLGIFKRKDTLYERLSKLYDIVGELELHSSKRSNYYILKKKYYYGVFDIQEERVVVNLEYRHCISYGNVALLTKPENKEEYKVCIVSNTAGIEELDYNLDRCITNLSSIIIILIDNQGNNRLIAYGKYGTKQTDRVISSYEASEEKIRYTSDGIEYELFHGYETNLSEENQN